MQFPTTDTNIIAGTVTGACPTPDASFLLPAVEITATMVSNAPSTLYDIGLWVATNGVSPQAAQSACRPIALPLETSGDKCYTPNSNSCGDVIK
jgi:hypothetical protein